LFIGGDGVARGYLNDSESTARRFVPDAFSEDPEARLYRSGDRVRWRTDGTLEFLGRLDRQVKIRGYRAEPRQGEDRSRGHRSVHDIAVELCAFGPDDRRLVAYVVPTAGSNPTEQQLRDHAARRLPAFLMPAAWMFLDRLPLSASGKVDRAALPRPPS